MIRFFIIASFIITHISYAEEIRLSIGEKKHLYFPGLRKIENMNKKLVRARIYPKKDRVTVTALSKGYGHLKLRDSLGARNINVIVYAKSALALEREIQELTAHIEGIHVRNTGRQVILSGNVLTPQDFETLKKIAKHYEKVINLTRPLPSARQIRMKKMIQVELKMIELNDNRIRSLGIQFPDSIRTHFSFNTHQKNSLITSTLHTTSQFDLIFRALEKRGLAKILANPKLICNNGGEATFLAGGEIPIRLANRNNISLQWKPHGIHLHIFPQADADHNISLKLNVEVSTIDASQSIEGVPGLLTRRVSTTVNVTDGETIVLSGLIHQLQSQDVRKVPLLSSIPLLGTLFSSKQHHNKKSELIIFVTPTIRQSKRSRYAPVST